MADIIDLYTQRGATISLQDAYDRAIKINPQVSDIMSKRAEAERVNAAAAAAQRARRTAASIGGSAAPAGAGPGPAGDSRRAEIEAAWDASQNS
jgi:regulator of protease activity HflC (stomatin/prohibitin superfamily)